MVAADYTWELREAIRPNANGLRKVHVFHSPTQRSWCGATGREATQSIDTPPESMAYSWCQKCRWHTNQYQRKGG